MRIEVRSRRSSRSSRPSRRCATGRSDPRKRSSTPARRIPIKADRGAAVLDRRQHLGPALEGGPIEDLTERRAGRAGSSSRRRSRRRTNGGDRIEFEAGCPVSLNGERLGLVELIQRCAEIGCRHGLPSWSTRGPHRRPEGARHLRVPGRGHHPDRAQGAGKARLHLHQNLFKPGLDSQSACWTTRGCGTSRAGGPERVHGVGEPLGHGHDRDAPLQGARRGDRRCSPNAHYDAELAGSPSRAGCSASRRARASWSCSRYRAGWLTVCKTRGSGEWEKPACSPSTGIRRMAGSGFA